MASRTTSTRLGADCSRSQLASASSKLRKNSPNESDIPSSQVRTHPPSMTTAQRHPQPATSRQLLFGIAAGVSLARIPQHLVPADRNREYLMRKLEPWQPHRWGGGRAVRCQSSTAQ